jgi:choice-of-anchor C domain-containing protein
VFWLFLVLLFLPFLPISSPGQVTETWFDGFENYATGAFPSPNWTLSGNSDIRVDSSVRASGSQSVRLQGVVGGCWAALLHRPLNVSPPFTLEFQTRNGSEAMSGCHRLKSTLFLHTGASWTAPLRALIIFDGEGRIRGALDGSNGAAGISLGTYLSDQWYKVKIVYERIGASSVRLSYWINDQFKASDLAPAFSYESQLVYVSPQAAEGTAWFDDIKITPGAQVSCSYSLSSPSQSFVSTGGAGNVGVTAPSGCNWQAVSNASWITFTSTASGSGSDTVSFAVAANGGTTSRSATLTIGGQTFTVTQGGSGTGESVTTYDLAAGWSDVVNPNGVWSYNGAPGRAITNRVTDWAASDNVFGSAQPAWAAAAFPAAGHVPMWFKRASDSSTLDVPVGRVGMHGSETSNAGVSWISPIDGAVDISGAVWQAAKTGDHAGRSMNWNLLKNGVTLTGGRVSGNDSFTSVSPFLFRNGSGGASALTNVMVSRGDVITIELFKASFYASFVGVDLTITARSPAPCSYSLSPQGQSFVSAGGSGTVNVTAPAGCGWLAQSNVSWISLTSATSGSGSGTVSYVLVPNPGTAARSGSLTIAGQTFTVNQSAGPAISILVNGSFESATVSPDGFRTLQPGDASISGWVVVGASIDYIGTFWQASDGQRSLDLDGTPTGPGGISQTFTTIPGVQYFVSFDMAGNPQRGFQTGPVVKPMRVSADGQSKEFTFDTTGRSFSNMGWMHFSWTFTADNLSATLEFRSLTTSSASGPALDNVSVIALTCNYLISPISQAFTASGGAGTVNITAPGGCAWQAVSHVTWVTLSSTTSGSGNGTLRYAVAANPTTAARSGALTIAGQTFTVTQADAQPGMETTHLFVPIVLSTAGLNNSFFTSELVLCNRGSSNATLEFAYAAAFGGGSGTAIDILPAGQQRIFSDALAYLNSIGIPIPASGNRGGTLAIRFSGLSSPSDVSATVRTTTAVPSGRAGLAYSGIPVSGALTGPAYLCGLRQNTFDRSNVAVQNAGTAADGDIVLRLTVFSGRPEAPFSWVLPEERLGPGDFRQISEILISNGLSLASGYLRVERLSGTAPYYAYAVINDQANSDGSFVAAIPENALAGRAGLTLPVIVETSSFNSELVLTNWSTTRKTLLFSFLADSIQAAGNSANFVMNLEPGQQSNIPNFVQFLRDQGVTGIGPKGPAYVGPLFATVQGGNADGVFLGARTAAPGVNGQYGLFYPAVPYGMSSTTSAWLYGLQQNAENRTNLALVNTGEIDGAPNVFSLDVFDGNTGLKATTVEGITLKARGWMQIGSILAQYASTTTHAYVRVTKTLGSNPFITYAVINDGAQPGQRTGDGAYIASSP